MHIVLYKIIQRGTGFLVKLVEGREKVRGGGGVGWSGSLNYTSYSSYSDE